jgi:pimeloyl-ACP methyl ester carboxylesterase
LQRVTDYLNAWLDQGYAIVATDYQGLGTPGGHPWLAVRPEGFSVLDSIRAALNGFPELTNSVVLVGQSQGAHAVLSASLLARQYAPDVNVKGTVATGVPGMPPFLPESAAPKILTPKLTGGNFPAYQLFMALAEQTMVPSFDAFANVTDRAYVALETARTGCISDLNPVLKNAELTVENEMKISFDDLLSRMVSFIQYPPLQFLNPVFVGAGLIDTDTFPEGQYNFAMAACHTGSTVELHYYPGKDHGGALNSSLPDSISFVKAAFAGRAIAGNCSDVNPPPARR